MGSGPRRRRSSQELTSAPLDMETGSMTCFSWMAAGGAGMSATVTVTVGLPEPLQVELVPATQRTVMMAVPTFFGVTVKVASESGGLVYWVKAGSTVTASPTT